MEDILKIYNLFNRVHNQFSVVKRKFIYENCGNPLFPSEMHILTIINSNPSYTVSDIADALYITRSAASQLVKKLCNKGFINKSRSVENERVVILEISETGKKAINFFMNNQSSAFGEMLGEFDSFDSRDVKIIELFLGKLSEMYDKKLS